MVVAALLVHNLHLSRPHNPIPLDICVETRPTWHTPNGHSRWRRAHAVAQNHLFASRTVRRRVLVETGSRAGWDSRPAIVWVLVANAESLLAVVELVLVCMGSAG